MILSLKNALGLYYCEGVWLPKDGFEVQKSMEKFVQKRVNHGN